MQVFFLAVLARILTPDQTGVAAAAGAVVGLLGLFSTFGISTGLIQTPNLTPKVQAVARTTLLVSALVIVALVEIFAPLAGRLFRNPDVTGALRVMVLLLLTVPFAATAFARLSRDLRTRDAVLAEALGNVAGAALSIPLALAGFGFWALAFGVLANTGLRAFLQCLFSREPARFSVDWRLSAQMGRFSSGFMMNGLLNHAAVDTPSWIIGRYLPVGDLGLYTRANSLVSYPAGLFASAVDRVIFPAVALVQDQAERVKAASLDAVRLVAVFGLPLTATLVFLGPDIIRVILGSKWEGAVEPFKILCAAIYFRWADRLNWIILRGLGRPYRLAVLQTLLVVITLAACVFGARAGLQGVAAAAVTTIAVGYLINSTAAMKAAGIGAGDWVSAHACGCACGLLAIVTVGPASWLLHSAGAAPLLVLAVCSCLAVLAGVLAAWLAPGIFLGQAGMRMLATLKEQIRARF